MAKYVNCGSDNIGIKFQQQPCVRIQIKNHVNDYRNILFYIIRIFNMHENMVRVDRAADYKYIEIIDKINRLHKLI